MSEGFSNAVVGGSGILKRIAIRSLNYVLGTTGWTINADGSAEFNNLSLRGTFFGARVILNTNGLFVYSGTPGPTTLFASVCGSSTTDPFATNCAQGAFVYGPSGSSISLINVLSQPTLQMVPPSQTHQSAAGLLTAQANNAGTGTEFSITTLTSGSEGLDNAALELVAESFDAGVTTPAIFDAVVAGVHMLRVFKSGVQVNGQLTDTSGTSSTPSTITNGGYTRIPSPYSNGWVHGGGGTDADGIIYQMLNAGNYEVWFDIINPAAKVNSIVTNLPAPFRPQKNFKHEIAGSIAGCVWMQFNTNGDVIAVGNTAANAEINGRCVIPTGTIP